MATKTPKKSKWSENRKGFRHKAIEAMREKGLSYREAKAVLEICVSEMHNALANHEEVCFDWGTLQVVRSPATTRGWRFGRVATLHKSPFKIIFRD